MSVVHYYVYLFWPWIQYWITSMMFTHHHISSKHVITTFSLCEFVCVSKYFPHSNHILTGIQQSDCYWMWYWKITEKEFIRVLFCSRYSKLQRIYIFLYFFHFISIWCKWMWIFTMNVFTLTEFFLYRFPSILSLSFFSSSKWMPMCIIK